jgi:hypothetical protein
MIPSSDAGLRSLVRTWAQRLTPSQSTHANAEREERRLGLGQPIACQLGPGLMLTGPPRTMLVPFIFQIEVWPFVF